MIITRRMNMKFESLMIDYFDFVQGIDITDH